MDTDEIYLRKRRKAREFPVEIGRFTFTCLRPNDAEAAEMYTEGYNRHQVAARFVVGWEGVLESDLIPSGGSDPVPFSAPLWRDWVADRSDFWAPIKDAVIEKYKQHKAKEADLGKT